MKKWQWLLVAGTMAAGISLAGCKPAATPEALCDKGLAEMKAAAQAQAEKQKDEKVKAAFKKEFEGDALKKLKGICLEETKKAVEKDKDYVKKVMDACKDQKGGEFLECVGDNQPKAAPAEKEGDKPAEK